jgi:Na+/alanine symporter
MADIFNGLMAIPNLIALICLSKVVSKETIEELKI